MKDLFTRYTNDVIATSAFGIRCDSLKNPKNEFYEMGKDITNFRGFRALIFFGYLMSPKLMKVRMSVLYPQYNVNAVSISMSSNVSAVRLLQHIETNNILTDEQFGFRTFSSTDKTSY